MLTEVGRMPATGDMRRWKASQVVQPLDSQPEAYAMSPEKMSASVWGAESTRCWTVELAADPSPMSAMRPKVKGKTVGPTLLLVKDISALQAPEPPTW
jgi:hypothetical protein